MTFVYNYFIAAVYSNSWEMAMFMRMGVTQWTCGGMHGNQLDVEVL